MKKIAFLLIVIIGFVSCSNDDDNNDESNPSIVIGVQYEFNDPSCMSVPIENDCFSSISFIDESQVSYLPFGDIVFVLPYEINGEVVTILLSHILADVNADPTFLIESEDVLVRQSTGHRFLRQ